MAEALAAPRPAPLAGDGLTLFESRDLRLVYFGPRPVGARVVGRSGAPLARRALDGAAASLREAGYEVTAEIAPGQPDEVIAERIKDGAADVLIMGAYGHSRIRNLIIGSTTTEMVRGCQIPLLLFR